MFFVSETYLIALSIYFYRAISQKKASIKSQLSDYQNFKKLRSSKKIQLKIRMYLHCGQLYPIFVL